MEPRHHRMQRPQRWRHSLGRTGTTACSSLRRCRLRTRASRPMPRPLRPTHPALALLLEGVDHREELCCPMPAPPGPAAPSPRCTLSGGPSDWTPLPRCRRSVDCAGHQPVPTPARPRRKYPPSSSFVSHLPLLAPVARWKDRANSSSRRCPTSCLG